MCVLQRTWSTARLIRCTRQKESLFQFRFLSANSRWINYMNLFNVKKIWHCKQKVSLNSTPKYSCSNFLSPYKQFFKRAILRELFYRIYPSHSSSRKYRLHLSVNKLIPGMFASTWPSSYIVELNFVIIVGALVWGKRK